MRLRIGSRLAIALGAWLVTAASGLLVFVRLIGVESRPTLVAALSLLPILLLPQYLVLALAVRWRRTILRGVSALLVIAHLALVVPTFWPVRDDPPVPRSAPRARVFFANIDKDNPDLTPIIDEIARAKADVVALIEVTPERAPMLDQSAALKDYPFRSLHPRDGSAGFAVWSKLPVDGIEEWRASRHLELRGWMTLGDRRVRLYVVHTNAPIGQTQEWQRELDDIRYALKAEPGAEPLLVLGDFNATRDHRGFRRILSLDLRDAAVVRGQGRRMTWPRDRHYPPLVRPDHVLVRSDLWVTGYRLGTGRGSDHRPLVVDLAFVPGT